MGSRGPVPKRSEERIRRNKEEVPIDKVTALGTVYAPLLNIEEPHYQTVSWYNSLIESAQSKYYEPSDWEYARILAHFLDRLLKNPNARGAAMMLTTLNTMMSNLLITEGDRRRVRLEVEREGTGLADVVDIASVFADRAKSA